MDNDITENDYMPEGYIEALIEAMKTWPKVKEEDYVNIPDVEPII